VTRIIYFDCFSGCSGDMILGALLDSGLSVNILKDGLSKLDIHGYHLTAEKVKKAAVTATRFDVVMDEHVHQHHRSLTDILDIIESSHLSERVKKESSAIFRRLGEAEGKVHGVAPEQVHFHEIGAVDSIVDIVGTIIAFEALGLEGYYSSALATGSGTVNTAHGVLPVPAPATLELLTRANAPIADLPQESAPKGELLTPTGAVLITSCATFQRPDMTLLKTGYGAGHKDFPNWPNILRVWIGDLKSNPMERDLVMMETNIDDMSPQVFGYLMEKLLAEKALDVWFTPIQMKKNRPAVMLSVLANASDEAGLSNLILEETSTLGIRIRPVARHIASREIHEFDSSLGRVKAKVKRLAGSILDISPEYEDCRRIAQEHNLPLQEVFRIVSEEAHRQIKSRTQVTGT
jgi:pyridinium-3,5-bisthiocarboxylic acid mononucleotide nickel chelatase